MRKFSLLVTKTLGALSLPSSRARRDLKKLAQWLSAGPFGPCPVKKRAVWGLVRLALTLTALLPILYLNVGAILIWTLGLVLSTWLSYTYDRSTYDSTWTLCIYAVSLVLVFLCV